MTANVTRLSGDDWEAWANLLLSQHYGPTDYQRVPAKDRGDGGIEGFCRSKREAFQCYGCEEPISVEERYKKQRDKMTADIQKFIDNKLVLQALFGQLKMKRWVFFVPHFDSKEIVAHAARKAQEVIDAGLPYVDDDFCVVVCQETDFAVARDQLINATSQGLKFKTASITTEDVNAWTQSNDVMLGVLKSKIDKLPTLRTQVQRDAFVIKVLHWYLSGQALLDRLREYPQVYEKVIETKSHREEFLAMGALNDSASNVVVRETIKDFKDTLKREAKELHDFCADQLAYEAVADWLIRCPLEFPEVANG
ncbi:hypothetical protein [Comamonas aquatica]|jgi:hypothetical protein|uniref:hypothetical protein n=1 Tax=Comamonas aquatica TaxID=225991 RepID=UPI00244D6CDE|nr:hypothetical protein [Comamonas aquatica]MDH0496280.1 hypothetical protein [Comamonas aquatica]MDH1676293.1 hypothetical protein [Comamonas aquatica]MDH1679854.1 hypothetical protein [Comamonas aquatica]